MRGKVRGVIRGLGAAAAVAAVLMMVGCGGDGGGGNATMRVLLTDLPSSEVLEVHVHITAVEVVGEGGRQVLLDDADIPDDIELIALAANPLLLGQPILPEGSYNQVRLIVSEAEGENWVVTSDEQRHDLRIPSGAQTGAKLVTGEFDVVAGQIVVLLLDFNAAASIHEAGASGQWIMRPTVVASVLPDEELQFGTIRGIVLDEAGQPLAVPENQVLGLFMETALGPIALAQVDATDGSFEIPALLAGSYELYLAYADTQWNQIGDPLAFRIEEAGDLMSMLELLLDPDEVIELTIVVP
ncbi:MAG: DUF4382 domain-containing protein [Armatimonadota bacterium]